MDAVTTGRAEETGRPSEDGSGDRLALGRGEGLLVSAWRKLATGQGCCPLLAREFSQAFGEEAAELLATLFTFLQMLAFASRRRIALGVPGSPALTGDERQLLALLAAGQAAEEARFGAHLRWLACQEPRQGLAIAARALGTALAVHGMRLALPAPVMPIRRTRHASLRLAPGAK
jgi:hypothetical protein